MGTMEAVSRAPYLVWSTLLPAGRVTGRISTGTAFPLLLDLCGLPPFPGAYWDSPRESVMAGRMPVDNRVYTYGGRDDRYRVTIGNRVEHYFESEGVYVTGLDDRPQ